MRLSGPDHDHALSKRALHAIIRRATRAPVPDVVLTVHHRPRFFGDPYSRWVEHAMRGPSEWTQGERELIAALVSARNQCVF